MPSYNYICESCGKQQDVFHSISKEIEDLPEIQKELKGECNKERCSFRKFIAPDTLGVIYKGNGFYRTDY